MTVYECVLEGKQSGNDLLTVLHYDLSGESPAELQSFVDAFAGQLIITLKPQLLSTVVYSGITIRKDTPGAVGVPYGFTAGDLAGTGAGEDAMLQAAMLVQKRSTSLVRPNLGRIYQGGLSVGALALNGTWDAGVRDEIEDFWESVRVLLYADDQTASMVIKASKPTAPNTQPYSPVTSLKGLLNPVTQRRRRIGSGS